jgi:hypothetical protein
MTLHAVGELVAQLDVEHARPQPPALRQPRGPNALVMDMLHRGMSDSYVPFSRKVDGEWQALGSMPAHQLRGLFRDEAIAEALQTDGYFGLHGMYRAGTVRGRHQLPQLQPALIHKDGELRSICRVDSVRYLTCCHVDLDAYNHGMDVHGAYAAVMRLVDAGTVPPPSVFLLSRGVWAMWHLHDKQKPKEPLRSYPESVMRRWSKLQNALHVACSAIGSDAMPLNAATFTRIPGSVNSKNGRRVGYMIPADTHGKAFSYTLEDLEGFLRPHVVVEAVPTAKLEFKPKNVKLSRRALKGWHGRWHRLNSVLCQLRDMRGGWKVGTRNAAVHYVALTLRALRAEPAKVQQTFSQHVERMTQPAGDKLTLKHCLRVFRGTKKPHAGGPCHQTIADALAVTPEEAALLSADRKKPFPPATCYGGAAAVTVPTLAKRDAAARRLAAVREVCERLTAAGTVPTGTDVRAHLAATGLHPALATVLADMRKVGCPSRQTHRQKPTEATRRLFPR